jgi:hypothetical protein
MRAIEWAMGKSVPAGSFIRRGSGLLKTTRPPFFFPAPVADPSIPRRGDRGQPQGIPSGEDHVDDGTVFERPARAAVAPLDDQFAGHGRNAASLPGMGKRQPVEGPVGRELDGANLCPGDAEKEHGDNANSPVAQFPIPPHARSRLFREHIIT